MITCPACGRAPSGNRSAHDPYGPDEDPCDQSVGLCGMCGTFLFMNKGTIEICSQEKFDAIPIRNKENLLALKRKLDKYRAESQNKPSYLM